MIQTSVVIMLVPAEVTSTIVNVGLRHQHLIRAPELHIILRKVIITGCRVQVYFRCSRNGRIVDTVDR